MIFKIMLLDDEPILLEGLARNTDWRAHGFELACTARHGFDGLEKFLEFQVDALLTDIRTVSYTHLSAPGRIFGRSGQQWPRLSDFQLVACHYTQYRYSRYCTSGIVNRRLDVYKRQATILLATKRLRLSLICGRP